MERLDVRADKGEQLVVPPNDGELLEMGALEGAREGSIMDEDLEMVAVLDEDTVGDGAHGVALVDVPDHWQEGVVPGLVDQCT